MELLTDCEDRSDMITAFLSVLELCSVGSVEIRDGDEGYELHFIGGDLDEILNSIEEQEPAKE